MTELNLGESKITHRQQIVQLLKMAVAQEWDFAYLEQRGKKVSPRDTRLVSVNTGDGSFAIEAELERPASEGKPALMFRAQSGGLSVMFKSRFAESTEEDAVQKTAAGSRFSLPYEISCTQLRKSTRFNVEGLEEPVPVVLYLAMGVQLNAVLIDISTTGAKFRVNQDLTEKCKNLQILEACRVELPDNFVLQCDAQLMGMSFDQKENMSYLRCQLSGIKPDDEDKLDYFIDTSIDESDPAQLAI
ncbi:MAG: PilZ domain-containing protein [Gammaproteobacteria bacterium]